MTKEQAFKAWAATLPAPVQQNMQDGVKSSRSYTREAFSAGWDARTEPNAGLTEHQMRDGYRSGMVGNK